MPDYQSLLAERRPNPCHLCRAPCVTPPEGFLWPSRLARVPGRRAAHDRGRDQPSHTIIAASPVVLRGAIGSPRLCGSHAPGRWRCRSDLCGPPTIPLSRRYSQEDNRTAMPLSELGYRLYPCGAPASGSAQPSSPFSIRRDRQHAAARALREKITSTGGGDTLSSRDAMRHAAARHFSVAAGRGRGQLSFCVPPPATSGHAGVEPGNRRRLHSTRCPAGCIPNESAPSLIDISPPFPRYPLFAFQPGRSVRGAASADRSG